MRFAGVATACAFVSASSVVAQACDKSTGYYIDPFSSTDAGRTGTFASGSSTGDGCGGDPSCENQLATLELEGNVQLGTIAEEGADGAAELAGGGLADIENLARRASAHLHRPRESPTRRQGAFSCDTSQTCLIYGNLPLCIDSSTGEFTDATGGYGNLNTGEYTKSMEASSVPTSENTKATATRTSGSTPMRIGTNTPAGTITVASGAGPVDIYRSTTILETRSSVAPTAAAPYNAPEQAGSSDATAFTSIIVASLLSAMAITAASLMLY